VRQRLPFGELVAALRQMFVKGCEVPQRHSHSIAGDEGNNGNSGTLLLMPAWRTGAYLGIKAVNIFPGNAALGLGAVHAAYTLFDARTGQALASMDGSELTARRTAASSALAASYLAREDTTALLLVGAGRVAGLLPQALRVVRPGLVNVLVWNHHPAGADKLAQQLRAQGFAARATTDLQAAVSQSHVICCATLSQRALVHGAWLAPGTHLDLIGSFTPQMRETDSACFARGRVFVDTAEALAKSGDLLCAMAEGGFSAQQLQATLAELCQGRQPGRGSTGEITVFKSVGTALADLAAAELVWCGADNPAT
jgi:ornithine cyclodeaminase/alanine dehydrogenase-like protein (mu-crystallin family)